jgi:hypothetical protein
MHLKTRETLNLHLRGSEFLIRDKNYCEHTHGQNETSISLLKHLKPNSKIRSPFIEFYTESQIYEPFDQWGLLRDEYIKAYLHVESIQSIFVYW